MGDIQYIGELLWPKYIGQFLILLSFFSTALAVYSYLLSSKKEDNSWKKLGNIAFTTQAISMLFVIGIIFYLMITKHYEYSYVQAHVSDDLPFQYIFSAFWEGQEGSFMLWIFWHNILAWVIMIKNTKWVAPTLYVISLIQLVLISMLLGIHFNIGDWVYKFGSNPLSLLRETMDIPLFMNAEYVSLLKGTGLNPLLQNYWMTIHPPVLFLGFASVSIPFAYALGSLLVKDFRSWLKPALKWALFSGAVLGIGILMGAAWAYEALTFGGYWAWDPVENTSLVPWIVMVAGIHTNLIARNTKYSVKSTYWFYILSFLLIVYSTTLTRSGILGDTSVHAFTEMGLEMQLGIFIALFFVLSLFYFFSRSRAIPVPKKEESIASKEFWMFIGTLVLLFSSLMITASSSLPIFNKIVQLFDPEFTSMVLEDPIAHYNKYQLWIGVLIGFLSACTIFFRYHGKNAKKYLSKSIKHLAVVIGLTLIIHYVVNLWLDLHGFQFHLLLFAGLLTIVSNVEYLLAVAQKNGSTVASTISHAGFGILIIGVLASGLNKKTISSNSFMFNGIMDEERVNKNIPLIKGKPMFMNNYWVEYESDTIIGQNRYFDLRFKKINDNEEVIEEFLVRPNVLYSNDYSKVAATNPATKHYLHKDIFTSIASLPTAQQDVKFAREMEDTLNYQLLTIPIDSSMTFDGYTIHVSDVNMVAQHHEYDPEPGDMPFQATINVQDSSGTNYKIKPATVLRSTVVYKYHDQINDLHSRYRINERSFETIIRPDNTLNYEKVTLLPGKKSEFKGYNVSFDNLSKANPEENINLLESDISVKANLTVSKNNSQEVLNPLFIIRDKQIIPIRDVWWGESFYARLVNIDPTDGSGTFEFAIPSDSSRNLYLEIANNVPRSDLIAIEVIEFPGINLVWWGCIAMMLGLGMGMFYRMSKS